MASAGGTQMVAAPGVPRFDDLIENKQIERGRGGQREVLDLQQVVAQPGEGRTSVKKTPGRCQRVKDSIRSVSGVSSPC